MSPLPPTFAELVPFDVGFLLRLAAAIPPCVRPYDHEIDGL